MKAGIITTIMMLFLMSFGVYKVKSVSHESKIKIGTFDSRAVTYAYFLSDMNKEQRQNDAKEREEIMKSKDTAKWVATMTRLFTNDYIMHQRVFATGSAASILRKIHSQLPEIARKAGVDIIVSKFELTWNDPNAIVVDVTDSIAQLFVPLSKIGKALEEMKNVERMDVEDYDLGETLEYWTKFEKQYFGK